MADMSALLVNCNGGERVVRAVQALLRQPHPLREVLVVDNGSTDDSPQRIAALDARVTVWSQAQNLGVARARNLGLARLTAPLALVLDHDIYVADDTLEWLQRTLRGQGATVVCPRIRLLPEQDVVQADGAEIHFLCALRLRHAYAPRAALSVESSEVGGAIGACLLLDRRAVLDAGGFEELMFFYQEDLELSLRLRARGLRIWCDPRAEVLHERGTGTPGLSFRGVGAYPRRRACLTMRHRLFTLLVHYQWRTLLLLAPPLLAAEFAAVVMALRKGWFGEWLRAWWWILGSVPALLRRRRSARRARRVGDGALLVGGQFPVAQAYVADAQERGLQRLFDRFCAGYWGIAARLLDAHER